MNPSILELILRDIEAKMVAIKGPPDFTFDVKSVQRSRLSLEGPEEIGNSIRERPAVFILVFSDAGVGAGPGSVCGARTKSLRLGIEFLLPNGDDANCSDFTAAVADIERALFGPEPPGFGIGADLQSTLHSRFLEQGMRTRFVHYELTLGYAVAFGDPTQGI